MKKIILHLFFLLLTTNFLNAQITYVNFSPDSVLNAPGELIIDIDQNFVGDIKFGMAMNGNEWAVYIPLGPWEIMVDNPVDWPDYALVSQLHSRDKLGLSNKWHSKSNTLVGRDTVPHFLDQGPKFIGIKSEHAFGTEYSWVLVELKSNPLTLIVYSAAMQKTNHTLFVGDTGNGFISLDEFKTTEVSIYPTVCNDKLTIQSSGDLKSIKIYNTLGQLSASSLDNSIDLPLYTMDINSLSPGIYTVMIEDANGKVSSRKIMVKDI